MSRIAAWVARNLVPIILIPLAAALIWVAVWRIWLPPTGAPAAATRTVTTVDANAATRPTHKVTSVVRTSPPSTPSRRSESLALALVFLGAGTAIVAVFHDRLGSFQLGKDGLKVELTPAEASGAAALVGRLTSSGAGARAYARGLDRYVRAVASRRGRSAVLGAGAAPGLTAEEAAALADGIADAIL